MSKLVDPSWGPGRVPARILAHVLRVSPQAVSQGVKAGRLVRGEDDLLDVRESIARWDAGTTPQAGDARTSGGAGDGVDYQEHRAIREKAVARQQQLRTAEMEGRLLAVEDVSATWSALVRETRDGLRSVGVRTCAELAATGTAVGCRTIVDRAVDEALERLADEREGGA